MKDKIFNPTLAVLKGLAIIIVIFCHTSDTRGGITLLSDWFSYYSFIIPLFIFCSGFFYKISYEQNFLKYLFGRIKRLIIPYYLIHFFFGVLILILHSLNLTKMGEPMTISNYLIDPWTKNIPYVLDGALWFVTLLFAINIMYILIRLLTKFVKDTDQDKFLLLIFIFTYFVTATLFVNFLPLLVEPLLFLNKVFFGILFFHFGYMANRYGEKIFKPNGYILALVFVTQFFIIQIFSLKGIYFDLRVGYMTNIFSPLITSLTGIYVTYQLAVMIVRTFNKSKFFIYIGQKTYLIMAFHILAFWVFNLILSVMNLPGFNQLSFMTIANYNYLPNSHFRILYPVVGLFGPLALIFVFDKSKKIYKAFIERL